MTNDDFIKGLIDINVQKGYSTPDKNTNTKHVYCGKFTFLYEGESITLERDNRGTIMEWNYFFNIGIYKYFISEEIYNQAKKYFYITNDYDKLKKKLEKDLRKIKIEYLMGKI